MHLCRSTFIASGGFEPLRVLPPGKSVVLVLVTSKTGTLEHPDDIHRIEEAAEAVWGRWVHCASAFNCDRLRTLPFSASKAIICCPGSD